VTASSASAAEFVGLDPMTAGLFAEDVDDGRQFIRVGADFRCPFELLPRCFFIDSSHVASPAVE
jgi:hypothetical protein